MTSANLVGIISQWREFKDRKVYIGPDEVYLAADLAQKDICSALNVLEGFKTLNLLASTERYVMTADVLSVFFIRKLSPNVGEIKVRSLSEIELNRSQFAATVVGTQVVYAYQIFTNPITLGFQGVPAAAMDVELSYYRVPLPAEYPSNSVNPVIPATYDKLLILGTLYHALDLRPEKEIDALKDAYKARYEKERDDTRKKIGASRFRAQHEPDEMVF